ncbi:MAG: hypothetical protein RLZZ299_1969 [Pseudomonadota bacterium]
MLLFALLGCGGGAPAAAPAPAGRVDVVAAAPAKAVDLSVWCDSRTTGADAPTLVLPELDGPPVASGTGWTWVNVWATWCGPCVAEMPMIRAWQGRLSKEGLDVNLQFLSVDEKAETLATWKASHPDAPPTMRVKEYAKVAPWLTSVGSDGSTVPVQVLADPEGKVRCVRSGALEKDHYEAIRAVIRGG